MDKLELTQGMRQELLAFIPQAYSMVATSLQSTEKSLKNTREKICLTEDRYTKDSLVAVAELQEESLALFFMTLLRLRAYVRVLENHEETQSDIRIILSWYETAKTLF